MQQRPPGEVATLFFPSLPSRQRSLFLVLSIFLIEFIPWKDHVIVDVDFKGIVDGVGKFVPLYRSELVLGVPSEYVSRYTMRGFTWPNSFQRPATALHSS